MLILIRTFHSVFQLSQVRFILANKSQEGRALFYGTDSHDVWHNIEDVMYAYNLLES